MTGAESESGEEVRVWLGSQIILVLADLWKDSSFYSE